METNKMQSRRRLRPLPIMPPPELLASGVAILPGGNDTLNLPLIIFPTKLHSTFLAMTPGKVVQLVKYYISITKAGMRLNGFAFLADLRTSSVEMFQTLVESLETLQKENRGSVAVFYCIQPRGKEAIKLLKRLLGIKDKKRLLKNPFRRKSYQAERGAFNSAFKTVLLEDLGELYRYIERRQLTTEFGGSLVYHHGSWILFRKELEDLYHKIDLVYEQLQKCEDKLDLLMEYDAPDNQEDMDQLIKLILNKYQEVMSDLEIEATIGSCTSVIEKCRNPSRHDVYKSLHPNPMIAETLGMAQRHHQRLVETRDELKDKWSGAVDRLHRLSDVRSHKDRAQYVMKWIHQVGWPKLGESIEVAENVGHAETIKNHFETGFYALAKETLYEADELRDTMDRIALENDAQVQENVEYAKNFQNKVRDFREELERRARTHQDVYHFYLLTGKMTRWYRRTLAFLPAKYLNYYLDYGHDEILPLSEEWNAEVNKYLYKHPAPRKEHIDKVRQGIPTILNMRSRNQARLLVHRVTLLRNLLVDGKIIVSDYRQLLRHKEKASHGLDELEANTTRSLPDLTRLVGSRDMSRDVDLTRAGSRSALDALDRVSKQQYDHLSTDASHMRKANSYHNLRITDAEDDIFGDFVDNGSMHSRRALSEMGAPTVRKFKSQPDVIGLPMEEVNARVLKKKPRGATPGKRFTKARDQRTLNSRTTTDSDNTADFTYPRQKKRNFSFHRQPPDKDFYGIYGESDLEEGLPSPSSNERPLSLPCTPPPLMVQTNFEHTQTLPANFRTRKNPLYSSLPDLLLEDLSQPLVDNMDSRGRSYGNLTPGEKVELIKKARDKALYSSQPQLVQRRAPVPPATHPYTKYSTAHRRTLPMPPPKPPRNGLLMQPRPPAFNYTKLTEEEKALIREVLQEKDAFEESSIKNAKKNPLYQGSDSDIPSVTEDGRSTDEDVRFVNEALRKRRLEDLRSRTSPLPGSRFQSPDTLSFTVDYLIGHEPTKHKIPSRESGVYGQSDSDYSGSDPHLESLKYNPPISGGYHDNGNYANEAPSDLEQLEKLEEDLQRHTYTHRKGLIEQSRDRMLKDLLDLDQIGHPHDPYLSPLEANGDEAFYY